MALSRNWHWCIGLNCRRHSVMTQVPSGCTEPCFRSCWCGISQLNQPKYGLMWQIVLLRHFTPLNRCQNSWVPYRKRATTFSVRQQDCWRFNFVCIKCLESEIILSVLDKYILWLGCQQWWLIFLETNFVCIDMTVEVMRYIMPCMIFELGK